MPTAIFGARTIALRPDHTAAKIGGAAAMALATNGRPTMGSCFGHTGMGRVPSIESTCTRFSALLGAPAVGRIVRYTESMTKRTKTTGLANVSGFAVVHAVRSALTLKKMTAPIDFALSSATRMSRLFGRAQFALGTFLVAAKKQGPSTKKQ